MTAPVMQWLDWTIDLFKLNSDALKIDADKGVWLGLQNLIPVTPCIQVIPEFTDTNIHGAPQFRNDLKMRIVIFVSRITELSENIREAVELGDKITLLLNSNSHPKDVNGVQFLNFAMVTKAEYGIASKEAAQVSMYRTVTLTYEAVHYEIMPNPTN